ncbi:general odorant-binding protein 56d-like [Phlebotomus argentipes]|uniref:general odorant-binding protein 56d-like n=1 Tax=Phlebotomus argentipes TaxID=94469 RepID=UPI00289327C9|nr:general odorant-binding protein 56d-like [Phlebotomus argentipes]
MNFLGVVVLVCAISAVSAHPGSLSEDVIMFKDTCLKETNVTPDQLLKFRNDDPSVTKPVGCYADCLSRKLGFLKEDNSFDAEGTIKMLTTEIPKEKVDAFLKKCANKIGKENCEVSLTWLKCDEEIVKKVLA